MLILNKLPEVEDELLPLFTTCVVALVVELVVLAFAPSKTLKFAFDI